MWLNPREYAGLITVTEEILNENFIFLRSLINIVLK